MKRKKAYTIPRKDNELSHIELEDKENKGVLNINVPIKEHSKKSLPSRN